MTLGWCAATRVRTLRRGGPCSGHSPCFLGERVKPPPRAVSFDDTQWMGYLRRSTIALLVVTSALAALSAVCAAAASSTRTPPHEPVADAGDASHTVCAVRELAYQRALAAQPHRAPLVDLFDALQLHTLCGKDPPFASSASQASRSTLGQTGADTDGTTAETALHVSPATGNDRTGLPHFRTVGYLFLSQLCLPVCLPACLLVCLSLCPSLSHTGVRVCCWQVFLCDAQAIPRRGAAVQLYRQRPWILNQCFTVY